jgi:hypothetical protein
MWSSFVARCCLLTVTVAGGCSIASDEGTTITHTLNWHQEPGTEIQDCHVFKLDNADAVEVDRITVQFPAGSHHVHIYRSDEPVDDSVASCWQGIDWTRWHLVLGAQTQALDWSLPPGLSVPLGPHQQLLVQVHWLNTGAAPIDGAIDLSFHTTARSDAHVGVVFGINKQTAMQPHERKVIRQWCAMPEGSQLLALMGHFHGLGQKYVIDTRPRGAASGDVVYDALDEQTFKFKTFAPPQPVPHGDGLQFECDFFNYRDVPITWSADTKTGEHCNMVAYYYPAKDLSTFCLVEYAEVAKLEGPAARVPLGGDAVYSVTLTEPAPAGGATIELASSDPGALAVPDQVTVPAGQLSATFTARALRPRRVSVTATLGGTGKTIDTTVAGLALSEVFTGPDQHQWVEIANLSDAAIDLSTFSLGAGRTDYTATRVPLAVTVPAHGCVVVGGPARGASQPPYDQSVDFAPDLAVAPSDAAGIALFDVAVDHIDATTLPYDALVYGRDNNNLVDPSGRLADVVAPPAATGTFVRTSSQWTTQAVGTPGICEVH